MVLHPERGSKIAEYDGFGGVAVWEVLQEAFMLEPCSLAQVRGVVAGL